MKKPTKRKSFNFLRSYFDVLNQLDKDEDKLSFLTSIINKQFLDQDPKGLNFIVNICYEGQRHSIEKSVKGYKDKMKTDILGNPTQGGAKGGAQGPSVQEKEKEKVIYIKNVSSPPKGVDALYFYLAKGYHKMFYDYKGSKSLQSAELNKWVNTIRLLIEVDNATVAQLIAIKKYLEAGINNERGVDTFWCDAIFSISALRKKSKDGTYYLDRIKQAAKKWLNKNPENESLVYNAEKLLMFRVNGKQRAN